MKAFSKILLMGFLIIILINVGYSQTYLTKEIKTTFKKEQYKDLKKIVDFFTLQISNGETTDFKKAFDEILSELNNNGWDTIFKTIDFIKQKELYNEISSETFDEIWSYYHAGKPNDSTKHKCLGLSYGKYMTFLKKIGKKQPAINRYYNDCYMSGDVEHSPYLQYNIKQLPDQFDLNSFNIQLLISINYLTINDRQKRDEIWIN